MEYADDDKAKKFAKIGEISKLNEAEERLRSGGWWAKGPYTCTNPECRKEIRKPRIIRDTTGGGKKRVSMAWCSQECFDKWASQFVRSPKLARKVERYDEQGNLIGYHVGGRFIALDEIDTRDGNERERDK